ncbi:MAG: ferrous iron transport protein B [Firmicutes bacterium]|nr:ferrous iron transport protein B [Bacillota bacterium]
MNLRELKTGESAVIRKVGGEGALRQHFLDMGVIPNAEVTLEKLAPMGDPMELSIHGYSLTLRLADAEKIEIEPIEKRTRSHEISEEMQEEIRKVLHPGLGEGGKYHDKKTENPLPEGTLLSFALAGNQNSGKTTLFNQLTGSNQHVGNFPGVTVDRKDGPIRGYADTDVVDLPGIYSLSPYSSEEIVSREYILSERPTGIINIVDASNIERNLYLTLQLLELETPLVVALNMMDEVRENGGSIEINAMEEMLGVPVVPISAAKNEGVDELVKHAIHVAQYQEKPEVTDFCEDDSPVHRCIHGIMTLIDDHAKAAGIPVRFAATKMVEGDERVEESLNLTQNEKEMIEHIILQLEEESGLDRSAAIAQMRFSFIGNVCSHTVVRPKERKEKVRSDRIDKVLTGKFTAIPAFIAIMGLIFWLTFEVIGAAGQDLLEKLIGRFTVSVDAFMTAHNVSEAVHGLVVNGIFAGVGSVLSFIPIIVVLFFFLSMLEDSGYMARVAFVMDKLLRKIGLSGRSIVPMLIGFGCSVPGVMSSRTLPSARDRKMTILMIPFMSCSAKIPIYAFFVNAFFSSHKGLIMVGLYLLSILVGIIVILIAKNTAFKGEAVPFVMELPTYRLPGLKNTLMLLWEKAKDFLQRAFTIIFMASIIVWLLQSFDFGLNLVEDPSTSILAVICGFIAPIFAPLGFGNWQSATSLISGFLAKESVVGTLEVLFPGEALYAIMSPATAASMLVFCLLYTPCVAAISSVKRELGGKWALGVCLGQCLVAWICAFITHIICVAVM